MVLISVDLPAPLSPIRPTISLRPILRSMLRRAWTAPKYFCTPSSLTMFERAPAARVPASASGCGPRSFVPDAVRPSRRPRSGRADAAWRRGRPRRRRRDRLGDGAVHRHDMGLLAPAARHREGHGERGLDRRREGGEEFLPVPARWRGGRRDRPRSRPGRRSPPSPRRPRRCARPPRGGASGREHGGLRLDHAAQLEQVADEERRPALGGLPEQHVGVEPVPVAGGWTMVPRRGVDRSGPCRPGA